MRKQGHFNQVTSKENTIYVDVGKYSFKIIYSPRLDNFSLFQYIASSGFNPPKLIPLDVLQTLDEVVHLIKLYASKKAHLLD
jgi:hypothetical protein